MQICYGTSKKSPDTNPLDLHILNTAEMNMAGLPQGTCFVLDRCAWMPWASEFFTQRDDGTGPIIGSLGPQSRVQLEILKVMRRGQAFRT